MGLKDYHESSVVNFMRFSRAQRSLTIRTIQAAFKDIEYARLKNENTLTVDEVHDILMELWESARDEIDNELSHQSHTYVLLLRQLFMQAENWHLKLQADISELENKLVPQFFLLNNFRFLTLFSAFLLESYWTEFEILRTNNSMRARKVIKLRVSSQ